MERTGHDILDHLRVLVGSSLVEVDHRGAQPRYRLLETMRLYARDRLADTGELAARRRAHAGHFYARVLSCPPRADELLLWAATAVDDADLGNHLAALDWLDRHDALADVGCLAARIPTVLGCTGFVDAEGRYLGREDVVAALDDPDERALSLTASAANASFLGRFRDQYVHGDAAREHAVDPVVRAAATFYLANACAIFDPRRIPSLVDAALAGLAGSATMMRQGLRDQPPLALVMEGRFADAADILEGLTGEGNGFAAGELMLVLYLLDEHQRALTVRDPATSVLSTPSGTTAGRLYAPSSGERAADWTTPGGTCRMRRIRSVPPRPLLNNDVLLGCASLAYHAGDHDRASEILATFRGKLRSPASFRGYLHYRDRLKVLSEPKRTEILERAANLDPTEVLDREPARMPTITAPHRRWSSGGHSCLYDTPVSEPRSAVVYRWAGWL